MSTEYVVLRRIKAGNLPDSEISWREEYEVTAASTEAALRLVIDSQGVYVVVPKRSFRPVKVEVEEVKPRIKFGSDA